MIISNDIETLKSLCRMTEEELMKLLSDTLVEYYDKVITTECYIYAAGTSPVCLVAHIDTVFSTPPSIIFHDKEYDAIWSPHGLGTDDRAGVFTILKILESGFLPSIIFTTGEEVGGIGAKQIVEDHPDINKILPNTCFLIELDRKGYKEAVFYQCGNKKFKKFIESFGFETKEGTFSDISILGPVWDIATVNLSIGYMNEHTTSEFLMVNWLEYTYNKVCEIIRYFNNNSLTKFSFCNIYKQEKNKICPICMVNKIDKTSHYIGDMILDQSFVCDKCYKEYFNF